MFRVWVTAAVLVAVGLAGCSDDGSGSDDQDEQFDDFGETNVSDSEGVIRGVVIDDSIQPVIGATVTVQNTELSTESNENGAFQFTGVEPGSHFLRVSKAGFETIQTSVNVEGGVKAPDVLKVQLPRAPGTEPFYSAFSYTGFLSCAFKLANIVFDAGWCDPTGALGMAARDDPSYTVELTTGQTPEYYQSEIMWEANQPLSSGLVTIQCARDNTGCGSGTGSDRLCNIRGPSPLICRIAAETPSDNVPGGGNNFTTVRDGEGIGDLVSIGVYSNCAVTCDPVFGVLGAGLALDQEWQSYLHVFYNYRPSEDWSFVDSGTVPEPPE